MESSRYTPRAPLSDFINCFWYSEGAPRTHSKERLLPNGECAVIFNLRDDPIRIYNPQDFTRYTTYGRAVFEGARSGCFGIDTDQQERVAGIQFHAGGAFPFFRIPTCEMAEQSVALDDLWRGESANIRERLLSAPDVRTMFQVLEKCLLERLARPLELHPAVAYAVRRFQIPGQAARVADVIDRIGLSQRRFIELFRREIGLSPKTFCRVRRFQRVLEIVHRKEHTDWAKTALDCGYYDQSHLIHDFQSLAGITPSMYLAARTMHLNHLPVI